MKGTLPSQGIRRKTEDPGKGDMRDAFSIDVDRILHSRAYTSYIDKTQVFYLVGNQGISHRVIHVQLLSRIARTIGRKLGLNDDLIEAIAIGHDIGHPPFGHDGENYLHELCMRSGIGAFRHNVQAIQSLERIEKQGRGLNLTIQVLDGILCHNGETTEQVVSPERTQAFDDFDKKRELFQQLEGCLVRVVDTVSYIGRDIEDAISLGIISRDDIPEDVAYELGDTNGKIVYALVDDLIHNSSDREVAYSAHIFDSLKKLKEFNYKKIYLNSRVKAESTKIRTMYTLVFDRLVEDIELRKMDSPIYIQFIDGLDEDYAQEHAPAEIVRDFIASLTDTAFLRVFHVLFVPETLG